MLTAPTTGRQWSLGVNKKKFPKVNVRIICICSWSHRRLPRVRFIYSQNRRIGPLASQYELKLHSEQTITIAASINWLFWVFINTCTLSYEFKKVSQIPMFLHILINKNNWQKTQYSWISCIYRYAAYICESTGHRFMIIGIVYNS